MEEYLNLIPVVNLHEIPRHQPLQRLFVPRDGRGVEDGELRRLGTSRASRRG